MQTFGRSSNEPIRMEDNHAQHNIDPVSAGFVVEVGDTSMAERDLSDDAQWKKSQMNTFKRWVNEHLKNADLTVNDLEKDFSSGVLLIALIQELTKTKIQGFHKKPVIRPQQLENVTLALNFLQQREGIRLVNIDSCHIVDQNLKMILGLIWTLILHYSISLMWETGDKAQVKPKPKNDQSPKQRIMQWVKNKIPEYPIRNFTTDWNSGKAIGALVDGCAPGLCPDWVDWDVKQPLANATKAMTCASQWLSVPQLVRPEEMVNPSVDEKAMMTYLSLFMQATLKEGAPLRRRSDPSRVRVFGEGVQATGNIVQVPCSFTVDTSDAGQAKLDVIVLNPKAVRETCEIVPNSEKPDEYTCKYVPNMEGEYRVIIKFGNAEVPQSPYPVRIVLPVGDPTKVTASGPGVDPNIEKCIGRSTHFKVFTSEAGRGEISCVIVDSQGNRGTVPVSVTRPDASDVYLVEYTPKAVGPHNVMVYFDGQEIPGTPFSVNVNPRESGKAGSRAELAYVTGRGVQPKGIRVHDQVSFRLHTQRANNPNGKASVSIVRSNGESEDLALEKVNQHLWECKYSPQRPGKHTLKVLYDGVDVQGSPFDIVVGPYMRSGIVAFGTGLHAGVVNQANIFTVVCTDDDNKIGFSISGPSKARTETVDNMDGSVKVTYWVTEPGEYAVHIFCKDEDIPNSPYMPIIHPDSGEFHIDRVQVYGIGVAKFDQNLCVNKPAEFIVDGLTEAIPADVYRQLDMNNLNSVLSLMCYDPSGKSLPLQFKRQSNGAVVCEYTPKRPGTHTVQVSVGHMSVKRSPFRVHVLDIQVSKVQLHGPGLQTAVCGRPMHFTIDPREAFPGEESIQVALEVNPISVSIVDQLGRSVPAEVVAEPGNTYRVTFTPGTSATNVYITPKIGQTAILTQPIMVAVQPDVAGIRVCNLDQEVFLASYDKFLVDASSIDPVGKGEVMAVLNSPTGEGALCRVTNNKDGTYSCSYTPLEEGDHKVTVTYEGAPVPGSPFSVHVVPGYDPSRVRAYGPGLEDGPHLLPNVEAEFTVDLTGAGQGSLGLAVEGPNEAPIECQDHGDGTCTVTYTPKDPGSYAIFIRFNDVNVAKSPYHINVKAKVDPSKVQCYGPGLQSGPLRSGWPTYFTVDTKQAGDAPLQVMFSPKPGVPLVPATIQPLGTLPNKEPPSSPGQQPTGDQYQPAPQPYSYHKVTYKPEADGPCRIEVTYAGQHVPGSPFSIQIRQPCEPNRVRVFGPGVEGPVQASLPTSFTVDARDAGIGDLTLGLSDPNNQSIPVRVVPILADNESVLANGGVASVASLASGDVSDSGLLQCIYQPYLVGLHTVKVIFGSVEVRNSPFVVQSVPMGRADLCGIKGEIASLIPVGEEYVIRVDTQLAGSGQLTCQVVQTRSADEADGVFLLPTETEDNGDGTTSVYYTPTQSGDVAVELRFGGQVIPNGEFVQQVVPPEQLVSKLMAGNSFRQVQFRFPAPKQDVDIECTVICPSGIPHAVPHELNSSDQTLVVVYYPEQAGMHQLHINTFSRIKSSAVNSHRSSAVAMPMQGSPYGFFVDEVGVNKVAVFGPGLSHGVTNQPAEFIIITKDAGAGGLALSVEGPSKAEITCKETKDGNCTVSYLPFSPGEYKIAIKYQNEHVSGSPFLAKITGDLTERAHFNILAPHDFSLDVSEVDIATLTASFNPPCGREEPCVLKRLPNNRLGISFTPKEVGEHLISVFENDQHIANSPFRILIKEKDIGDSRRVRVTGPGLVSGVAKQPNEFTVDTQDAGYAGLSLSIEGPSKADIKCHDHHDGTCSVVYTPTEPGNYVINVKYADRHVTNSPFHVHIKGSRSVQMMERITRQQKTSSVTNVGSRCEISLRVLDTKREDVSAVVSSPSRISTACEVIQVGTDHYTIKFVPREMGEHYVTVKKRGVNIAGSPFLFTVGPITDGAANKVQALGPGLQQGLTNQANEFTVYTREAGAGTLAIAIEGPSKAIIDCTEQPDGSSAVTYRVSQPGIYTCSLIFDEQQIPFSPFRINVIDPNANYTSYLLPSESSQHLSAAGSRLDNSLSQLSSPVSFTVHHEASGDQKLVAIVQTPSGQMRDAVVESLADQQDQHTVRFVPQERGPHLVYVHEVPADMADRKDLVLGSASPFRRVRGSPFRLVVSHQAADPDMVLASGEGLYKGRVDEVNTFFVNTEKAGSGMLNVAIDGPTKVKLVTEERKGGYTFSYVPPMPGTYDVSIKYGGDFHIAGSPFQVAVTGSPKPASQQPTSVRMHEVRTYTEKTVIHKQQRQQHAGDTAAADTDTEIEEEKRLEELLQHHSSSRSGVEQITCDGPGLRQGILNAMNLFSVDTSQIKLPNVGDMLLVGARGPTRPCDKVKITHKGGNIFSVAYWVQEKGQHVLNVKWGDHHIPGSPFIVNVL